MSPALVESPTLVEMDRRTAFTGLLITPIVNRHTRPDLWALVRRHRPVLGEWFRERLGYRLVVSSSTARLYRLPLGGAVTAPVRARPPSRRVLVLGLLAAAAAEDVDELTTTQELSDRVRALTARQEVEILPYDSDRFTERRTFTYAVALLADLGVLRAGSTAREEVLEGWAHHRDALGGAYHVDREALLRLLDPVALAAVLGAPGSWGESDEATRRVAVMRRLIELPVCLFVDLSPDELRYLVSQRTHLAAWCREMTGWTIEQRAEGIALIPLDESDTDLAFPKVRADHFGALLLLDHLHREKLRDVDEVTLTELVRRIRREHPKAMTDAYRKNPVQLEGDALAVLLELDLVRARPDGGWTVMPAAARFRNPRVEATQMALDGEGGSA